MKANPIRSASLDYLRKVAPTPWYLDQDNAEGVCVKDSKGQIVYYEEYCFPDEMKSFMCEAIADRARALARFLIDVSEAAYWEDIQ